MKTQCAFTILEILISVTLISIMLLITVCSFQDFTLKNRVTAEGNLLVNALEYAKYTAITNHENIVFCGSTDHQTCDEAWNHGQIITDPKGKVIRIFAFPKQDRLAWKSNFGKNNILVFTPNGSTLGQQGSFYYCPKNSPSNAIAIILEQTGRVRLSTKTADSKTIPCDPNM